MCPSGTLRFKPHASSFMAVLQYPLYQSEYRQRYSTDAALLKVANDLSLNMNSQHVTLLLLLDLSAAFDTVNHEILVRRLNTNFGVRGKVLLPRRSQRISLSELCNIWKVWLTFWRSNGLLYGALTVCRLCFRAVWYYRVTFTWSSQICWWHSIILIIKTWWCQCARRGRCSYGELPLLVIPSSSPKQLSRIISKFKHCTGWG